MSRKLKRGDFMHKNKYFGYRNICRNLIDFICTQDYGHFDSRFVDLDGNSVSCDMGYLLEGLRAFEQYFDMKYKNGEE